MQPHPYDSGNPGQPGEFPRGPGQWHGSPAHGAPGWPGFGAPLPKKSRAWIVVLVVVLAVGAVGGYFGVRALSDDDSGDSASAGEPTGAAEKDVFTSSDKAYSVEIPAGVVRIDPTEDDSIPSDIDLSLAMPDPTVGGMIRVGTLAGEAADGTYDEVADEAEQKYTNQYGRNPEKWGTGAAVERRDFEIDGRKAAEVSARFSRDAEPEPSAFFRVIFIEPPSGPALLITCDWNDEGARDLEQACESVVDSFTVTD
jgi:hypothetical protein